MADGTTSETLIDAHILEFPGGYKRSVGPVVGRFLTGLRDGQLVGVRTPAGRVLVPPAEYDPETGAAVGESADDFVDVGPEGVVTTWAWVRAPRLKHPLDRPFAWALIRLDGADTQLLHVLDAGSEDAVSTGMRVRPRWRPERVGHITDIEGFEPVSSTAEGAPAGARQRRLRRPSPREPEPATATQQSTSPPAASAAMNTAGPVTTMHSPIRLEYRIGAGTAQSRFLRGLVEGKLLGQKCPVCSKVYMPPRGSCPIHGVATEEEVELPDTGTVTTFCVVNIPFSDLAPEVPYVCAQVLLDGADTALFGLIAGMPASDVRMGLRVRAEWKPREEWVPNLGNIKWWEPSGEPDADYDAYKDYI